MSLILVAEPDQHLLEGIRDILELEGFDVLIANDADTALQLVREHHPDFIVSELGFRGFKGGDFIKAVRADSTIAATPFIILTVQGEAKDVRKALFFGANEVVVKPYDPLDLVITVITYLHKPEIIKPLSKMEQDIDILVNHIGTNAAGIEAAISRLTQTDLNLTIAPAPVKPYSRGENDKAAIALVRRSRCIVTVISTDLKPGRDRNFWSQVETRIAHLIGIPIFLVHVSGDEKQIPADLKGYYRFDARENADEAYAQLIERVRGYLDVVK